MKTIKSINNEHIKYLYKLKDKKYRQLENKFLIEGYHLVDEASKMGLLEEVLILDEKDEVCNTLNILTSKEVILKLSSTKNPQDIIGVCKKKANKELTGSKFLLLDNVNDPGNLGTLIRSSVGFGIDTIVLSEDSVDVYNDKVIRATQGAIFKVNIIYLDLKECINKLKLENIKVIGTSLKESTSLKTLKNIDKYAIVLGNEANGVREDILNLTDMNVKIEINKNLESLNVAVAGSIIMYYLSNNKE